MCKRQSNVVKATRIFGPIEGESHQARVQRCIYIFVDHFSQYIHVEIWSDFSDDSVDHACNAFEYLSRYMGDSV